MTRRAGRRRLAGLLLAPVVALTGCAEGDVVQRQPETGGDGFQATGRLGGSRVAISTGDPVVTYGDCDPGEGRDQDLCLVVRTIDGVRINVVIENPGAMVEGEVLQVRGDPCSAAACDDVTGHAVVDVRVDGDGRRATGGTLRTRTFGDRVVADVDLRFADGDELRGSFDVSVAAPSNLPPPPPTGD